MGAIAIADEIQELQEWMDSDRFKDTVRVYPARLVAEQKGTVPQDYTIARNAAEQFYARLRELFAEGRSITSFGPYSPGQVVQMKRSGIEGIYLGGWATSAKGSTHEDPGPDLASYPLSQVPDEAAGLVRALLTADKNQRFTARAHDRGRARRPPPRSTSGRSSSPTPTPATAATRTSATWSAASSRRASPATTSRTRSPAPRSAATRAARCSCPRTSRSSASTRPASSSTSWACPASSSPAPTPRRPTCSTARATSATSRSSSASPTPRCPSYKVGFLALIAAPQRRGRRRAQRPPALRDLRRGVRRGRRVARADRAWPPPSTGRGTAFEAGEAYRRGGARRRRRRVPRRSGRPRPA